VAAGAALLGLGVALALLALQVWRWPAHAAEQDALLTRSLVPARAWSDDGGFAGVLLGVGDDVEFRRAVVSFRRGRPDDPATVRTPEQIVSSAEAAIALAAIARSDAPAARRSQAANLLAIQSAETAILDPDAAARIRAAVDLLRQAIRLDPTSEAPKANLELMLDLGGAGSFDATSTGGFGGFGDEADAVPGGGGY
jgi:hypothetical protein